MFKGFFFGVLLSPPLVHFKRIGCTTKHTAHHAMSLPIPNKCARALAKKALDTARNVTKQNHSKDLETMWRTGHDIVFSGHRVSGGRMSMYKYIFIIYNFEYTQKSKNNCRTILQDPVEHDYVYLQNYKHITYKSIEHKCNSHFQFIIYSNNYTQCFRYSTPPYVFQ